MAASPAFTLFSLNGVDAQKFLQGQVTLNTETFAENQTRYTAICSLKGRIQFGLWLKKISPDSFVIVMTEDQSTDVANYIKKFSALSKMKVELVWLVYPVINGNHTDFVATEADVTMWEQQAIESGQA